MCDFVYVYPLTSPCYYFGSRLLKLPCRWLFSIDLLRYTNCCLRICSIGSSQYYVLLLHSLSQQISMSLLFQVSNLIILWCWGERHWKALVLVFGPMPIHTVPRYPDLALEYINDYGWLLVRGRRNESISSIWYLPSPPLGRERPPKSVRQVLNPPYWF